MAGAMLLAAAALTMVGQGPAAMAGYSPVALAVHDLHVVMPFGLVSSASIIVTAFLNAKDICIFLHLKCPRKNVRKNNNANTNAGCSCKPEETCKKKTPAC